MIIILLIIIPVLYIILRKIFKKIRVIISLENKLKLAKAQNNINETQTVLNELISKVESYFTISRILSFVYVLPLILYSGAVLLFCDSGPISMCYLISRLLLVFVVMQIILPLISGRVISSAKKNMSLSKINTSFVLMSVAMFLVPTIFIIGIVTSIISDISKLP